MTTGPTALGEPQLALIEMSARDEYKVCKDDHDPRTWVLRARDDTHIGKVTDLIVDENALTVRYLVCHIAADARRILIPTGFARLDDKTETVHLDFLSNEDVARLPTFRGLPLSSEQQQQVETALTGRAQFEAESIIQRRVERRD
jgi:hypothetical protein